ncbi:hypothetical protein [Pararobbsia silviterrae]|uniref:DUF4398 domain-containing protein n=1 Tax=Pararobbsia silviterrae TaxID=1792498 RepID=A0A494XPY6_9BURK|nr:hypothetical protein [Pararobbsia silviterrae]RKP51771.1 hypothetical protein D7S86_17575 [Pararobbsia silviterrae]
MRHAVFTALALGATYLALPGSIPLAYAADASANADPFVTQRNAIQAANQAYRKEVAVAQHEFDRIESAADADYKKAVAQAKAERNRTIAHIKSKG